MKTDIRRTTESKARAFCKKHGFRYRVNRHGRCVIGKIRDKDGIRLAIIDVIPDETYTAKRKITE